MNKQELLSMIELSGLAYGEHQPLDKDERVYKFNSEKTGVQYSVRILGDTIKIIFRGTDSLIDAMTDFRFWRKSIPYGNYYSKIKVHNGFINAYKCEDVRDEIHTFITNDIEKIWITGHSYGAALACLCAIDLQYNFPEKDYEVALFGCPRLGNSAFQRSYDKRIFKTIRVENGNDVITKLPFAWMGFRHIGTRLHVGSPRILFLYSVKQHKSQSYYEQMIKL
ncbi:lipase family protein [Paludicola sp. MB14-C6]|uniref:lipase family protein n=1 Tax=Paludihabitans sp. MB14-C6 TaxID=3070656 RepID=UPI0027DE124D|nr:lipase family protein [Paludicola sp. MB14-C6]WMJ22769.1 lipase family protein [Paludicola sp. MB14-C6]